MVQLGGILMHFEEFHNVTSSLPNEAIDAFLKEAGNNLRKIINEELIKKALVIFLEICELILLVKT